MKKTTGFLGFCSLIALTATAARAADGRFYGGLSVGRSSVNGRAQAGRLAITGSAGVSRAQFDVDGTITALIATSPTIPSQPSPRQPIIGILPPGVVIVGAIQTLSLTSPKDETGGYWKVGLNWRFNDAIETGLSYGKRDLHVERVKSLALSLSYAF